MDEDLRLAAIQASKLFKKGQYEEAVDVCTMGITDYPQYSSLYLILAKSYIALGDVSEAHKVFESASKFFVNDPLINTLKDILEVTPHEPDSVDKKKSRLLTNPSIEPTEVMENHIETSTNEVEVVNEIEEQTIILPIENQEIEEETFSISDRVTISDDISKSESIIETQVDEIGEDTISEENTLLEVEETMEETQIVFENEYDSFIESEEVLPESIEAYVNEPTFTTDVNATKELDDEIQDEVKHLEYFDEIESVETSFIEESDTRIKDSDTQIEESDTQIEDSSYVDILNEFDSLVSARDVDSEPCKEDEFYNDEVYKEETESNKDVVVQINTETASLVSPPINFASTNFLVKAKQVGDDHDTSFYSSVKLQAQQILPQFQTFVHTEKKSHHIEEVVFQLENPLQNDFLHSVSELVAEPIEFVETYHSDRSKYTEAVEFEHSVESIEATKNLFISNVP